MSARKPHPDTCSLGSCSAPGKKQPLRSRVGVGKGSLRTHVVAHSFPDALPRIRQSFTHQPDFQTCGAAAIRHGLLLGGLTIPLASLESALAIRRHEGTYSESMLRCFKELGFEARTVRKPARKSTAQFLDSLKPELEKGAFLLPCIHSDDHWVCLGAWQDGHVWMVDSYHGSHPNSPIRPLIPQLGFFRFSAEEFEELRWAGWLNLVRPGIWQAHYDAWLPARATLLRQRWSAGERKISAPEALEHAVQQYLNDANYCYTALTMCMAENEVTVAVLDPGEDAASLTPREDSLVVRRLFNALEEPLAAPELVVRASAVRVAFLRA